MGDPTLDNKRRSRKQQIREKKIAGSACQYEHLPQIEIDRDEQESGVCVCDVTPSAERKLLNASRLCIHLHFLHFTEDPHMTDTTWIYDHLWGGTRQRYSYSTAIGLCRSHSTISDGLDMGECIRMCDRVFAVLPENIMSAVILYYL